MHVPRLTRLARRAAALLPRVELIERACRLYLQSTLGEGNSDLVSNGELTFLRRAVPACPTIFDVGANEGEWSQVCLSINPRATVHAFEPLPTTFDRLKAAALGPSAVLVPLGLSDREGSAELFTYGGDGGNNSMFARSARAEGAVAQTIRLTTGDQYCRQAGVERIDLLKLDVEGNELAALRGFTGLLDRGAVRLIQIEYGGTYIDARVFLKDIFEHLLPRGYRAFKVYPRRLEPVPAYSPRLETLTYSNYVFAHPEAARALV